jgi:four helix bundle protein
MKSNEKIILNHSFRFATTIVGCYKNLVTIEKVFVFSKQLLRSGTAIGALVQEAQNAESTRDFIHKLGIAQKECAESQYWLELLKVTGYINQSKYDILFSSSTSILKMIRSAIITSKKKANL